MICCPELTKSCVVRQRSSAHNVFEMVWRKWYASWRIMIMAFVLVGCGMSDSQTVQVRTDTPVVTRLASPTPIRRTPSPMPSPTVGITASPTEDRQPASSPTPIPGVEVVLILKDCLRKFCAPEELDQQISRAEGEPGFLEVEVLGELSARLVYDPTKLTEEEAVRNFGRVTRMEVEIDR